MFQLDAIQAVLREYSIDGWLMCDFRGSNVLAERVLQISPKEVGSRRYYYCIPAEGEPRKLVHRIESGMLDHLPGSKTIYLTWQSLEAGIRDLVEGMKTVAMEYSPRNANPYVSRVDAGTVELVRDSDCEIVSSGDLIQRFEAVWTEEQWALHLEVAEHTNSAFTHAWNEIADKTRHNGGTNERAVQKIILDHFHEQGMVTSHPPIVGVGPNSGNPHYETGTGENTDIGEGDFVLIDLWAKLDRPMAVYSDLTRVGFVGETVPKKYNDIFKIVAAARDAAVDCVREAFSTGRVLQGWEVDRASRKVIEDAGYGEYFVHRTGHNIGQETHGNGANMDDLETHEDRRVMKHTCFSVEPGIYLPEFGVRSEVNVFVDGAGEVHVTGGELQTEVIPILGQY
ncbi:MAG: M24 family metallopeptidase [Planctomycetaceae bacterium]